MQNSFEPNTKKKGGETMKKVLLMTAAIALFAVPAMAAVSNTKHNLSTTGTSTVKSTNETQICVFCHTPHNATQNVPLWNRSNPSGATIGYTGSATINMNVQASLASDSISRFCLSCHDGNAISTRVVNKPNGAIAMSGDTVSTAANIGMNLMNDHPVGFTFDPTLDTRINSKIFVETAGIKFFTSTIGTNNQLECASCHDVHDFAVIPKYLRINNAGSALCLTCHIK